MQYTGPDDAICPITHLPLGDLEHPVAFKHNTAQPYECEALARWLMTKRTDPMTNLPVCWVQSASEVIFPIKNGTIDALLETLDSASTFNIVAHIYNLRILGAVASDQRLFWPNAPFDISSASFVYTDGSAGWMNLNWNGARFESTLQDEGNMGLLVYHSEGQTFGHQTIQCLVVSETSGAYKRLHLVHLANRIEA